MQVSVADGGTKELALQGIALATFTSISNELNNPKPLNCPLDFDRDRTNSFDYLTSSNISYFVSINVSNNSSAILGGDRNVCVGGRLANGLVEIPNPNWAAWGVRIHTNQGNVVFADGSFQQMDDRLLRTTLRNTGLATNRFLIP